MEINRLCLLLICAGLALGHFLTSERFLIVALQAGFNRISPARKNGGRLGELPHGLDKTLMLITQPCKKFTDVTFSNCALVGSAANLLGKGRGAEIDAHFPVVRVNRLPTEAYFNDFGNRTDLLFSNRWELYHHNISVLSPRIPNCSNTNPSCYPTVDCSSHSSDPLCPSSGIIFKGVGCEAHVKESWSKASIPAGCLSHLLTDLVQKRFNHEYSGSIVSTGMMAFLAIAPHCSNLTMYGFIGDGSADGHTIKIGHNDTPQHDFGKEHVIYNMLWNGSGVDIKHLTLQEKQQRNEDDDDYQLRSKWLKWMVMRLNAVPLQLMDWQGVSP